MKKSGGHLLTQKRPLNVLQAPEITIRHLPVASSLAQFSWGPQASLTSSRWNSLSASFHSFLTPPNNARAGPHQLWPFFSPSGQWNASTFPKRYVWRSRWVRKPGSLSPSRPPSHPCWTPLLPTPLPQGSAVLHHRQAPDRRGLDICSCFLLPPLMGIALLSEEECTEQESSK